MLCAALGPADWIASPFPLLDDGPKRLPQNWGCAVPEDQDLSVRAIADALAKARLPIDLSAMILAIARVESGFNPFSEHPVSTACGLFQFVEGTWEAYQPTRDTCFDPYVNAWAGEHTRVRLLDKILCILTGT